MRKVAISCLRQLCQKDSLEVCQIAINYVKQSKPVGLLSLINEQRGLECLLFKLLDIETNPYLIRDIHDILNSLLCTSLNEHNLKRWLFLLKDIAISADDNNVNNEGPAELKVKKDDEDEDYDDSESFKTNESVRSPSVGANLNHLNNNIIRMKQITKMISPKWLNRVFGVELIRRIMCMCLSLNDEISKNNIIFSNQLNQQMQLRQNMSNNPHFSLLIARKLKLRNEQEDYLILFLQDLMRIACIAATSSCDPLKLVGLDLLNDLIVYFGQCEEPNPEFKGHLILEQYQAQVSACLRAQFSSDTSAHVVSKACQVCSTWISSGVARDLNDLRRVHQLLVTSLQKLTNVVNSSDLIYSELSLTVEKLAVLRAWSDVYIIAKKRKNTENLLSLVQPELALLSHHWSIALKDYAFLSLPNDYSSQLPIEGGAFYHADLVESSRPVYREHFTKILLAYSIWLNDIDFNIDPANQKLSDTERLEQKEKLFFMLLGLSLEHLSNTTGLAKLNDETIETILESIVYLLNTSEAKLLLSSKKSGLLVEILSILYKVKLTRDVMAINLLVIQIVNEVNQLRLSFKSEDLSKTANSLIYVILEILIRDLIKYVPDLLTSKNDELKNGKSKLFII